MFNSMTAHVKVWMLSERERDERERSDYDTVDRQTISLSDGQKTDTHSLSVRYLRLSHSHGYTLCISWRSERGLSLSPEFLQSERTSSGTSCTDHASAQCTMGVVVNGVVVCELT